MQLAFLFLTLCASNYAAVHFTDSILLDEFDLAVPEFQLDLCAETACKLFVSAPKDSYSTLDNIVIGKKSLGDIARSKNHVSRLKTPYISMNEPIVNNNPDSACGPVAVYIVAERADFYGTALVYEPERRFVSVKWKSPAPMTVLSVEPFQVAGKVKSGSLKGSVITTGFDNVKENSNKCLPAADFRSENQFTFDFNGPLATLYSETEAEVELNIGRFQVHNFALDTPVFVSSSGYIGCRNGDVYRSSLYATSTTFRLTNKKKISVHVDAYLNTEDTVQIFTDHFKKSKLTGSIEANTWNQSLDLVGEYVRVLFEPKHAQSSFMLKFSPTSSSSSTLSPLPILRTTEAMILTTDAESDALDVERTSTSDDNDTDITSTATSESPHSTQDIPALTTDPSLTQTSFSTSETSGDDRKTTTVSPPFSFHSTQDDDRRSQTTEVSSTQTSPFYESTSDTTEIATDSTADPRLSTQDQITKTVEKSVTNPCPSTSGTTTSVKKTETTVPQKTTMKTVKTTTGRSTTMSSTESTKMTSPATTVDRREDESTTSSSPSLIHLLTSIVVLFVARV